MIKPFSGNFTRTQGFGENSAIYARFGLKGHNGYDYATPNDTPILAAITGKVVEATSDSTGYGNYIKIENDKEGVLVAHLRRFTVSVGQEVNEGQLIGYSNNTGFSSGPHLHFGYFRKPRDRSNGYSGYIDPAPYFRSTPLPVPPTNMTDLEKKKLVQFDRSVIELFKAGIIPSNASEWFFANEADPDKFTNLVKRLIRDQGANEQNVRDDQHRKTIADVRTKLEEFLRSL